MLRREANCACVRLVLYEIEVKRTFSFSSKFFHAHTVYTDQRPEMRELQLIKWYKGGQEKHLRIIASTAPQWENLGTTFGISPAELKGFKLVNMLNQEGCYRDVLQRWLQNGSQPRDAYAVTWRGLIQALRDTSLRKIADELQTALCKSELHD